IEKIKALRPDLVICNKEENTQRIVEELEPLAPVWVSDINTLEDSLDMIRKLGVLLSVSERASEIITMITSEADVFAHFMLNRPVRKVAYLIWKKPYMAAGSDSFIHELLKLNKFQNIIVETRYPEVSVSVLKEADLILLSSEPYPFKEKDARELEALTGKEVRLVDGEFFSWYGSRLQAAFSYFRTLH
ncbi:MAG: helical backbone metal receptor, partial [Bacteroidota bacterium]